MRARASNFSRYIQKEDLARLHTVLHTKHEEKKKGRRRSHGFQVLLRANKQFLKYCTYANKLTQVIIATKQSSVSPQVSPVWHPHSPDASRLFFEITVVRVFLLFVISVISDVIKRGFQEEATGNDKSLWDGLELVLDKDKRPTISTTHLVLQVVARDLEKGHLRPRILEEKPILLFAKIIRLESAANRHHGMATAAAQFLVVFDSVLSVELEGAMFGRLRVSSAVVEGGLAFSIARTICKSSWVGTPKETKLN